jgi:hypothetical protein
MSLPFWEPLSFPFRKLAYPSTARHTMLRPSTLLSTNRAPWDTSTSLCIVIRGCVVTHHCITTETQFGKAESRNSFPRSPSLLVWSPQSRGGYSFFIRPSYLISSAQFLLPQFEDLRSPPYSTLRTIDLLHPAILEIPERPIDWSRSAKIPCKTCFAPCCNIVSSMFHRCQPDPTNLSCNS